MVGAIKHMQLTRGGHVCYFMDPCINNLFQANDSTVNKESVVVSTCYKRYYMQVSVVSISDVLHQGAVLLLNELCGRNKLSILPDTVCPIADENIPALSLQQCTDEVSAEDKTNT